MFLANSSKSQMRTSALTSVCMLVTLVCSSGALAQELPKFRNTRTTVRVPSDLAGVSEDRQHQKGDFYEYSISGQLETAPRAIPISTLKPLALSSIQDPWTFVGQYVLAMHSGQSRNLRALMSEEGVQAFSSVSDELFRTRTEAVRKFPEFTPLLAMKVEQKILMYWLDGQKRPEVAVLKETEGGGYLATTLKLKSTPEIDNVILAAQAQPSTPLAPKLIQTPSKLGAKSPEKLVLEVSRPGQFAYLYFRKVTPEASSASAKAWQALGIARDGQKERAELIPDQDARARIIEIQLPSDVMGGADELEFGATEVNFIPAFPSPRITAAGVKWLTRRAAKSD